VQIMDIRALLSIADHILGVHPLPSSTVRA
jgi:hypothetical protein